MLGTQRKGGLSRPSREMGLVAPVCYFLPLLFPRRVGANRGAVPEVRVEEAEDSIRL